MSVPALDDFLERFPEFGEQSTDLVEKTLAEAGRSTSVAVWGGTHTEGVAYLAAHLLATRVVQLGSQIEANSGTPFGARIEATLYGQEYKRLLDNLPICGFSL